MTRVSEVMTRGVRAMTPNESLAQAAQAMGELDVGVIPVFDGERIVGIVTDRDLVVRGVAQGRAPDSTPLRDVIVLTPRANAARLLPGDDAWCRWSANDVYVFSAAQADLVLADPALEAVPE